MIQLSSPVGEAVALLDLHVEPPVGVIVHGAQYYVYDGVRDGVMHYAAVTGMVLPGDAGRIPPTKTEGKAPAAVLPDLPDQPDMPDVADRIFAKRCSLSSRRSSANTCWVISVADPRKPRKFPSWS
jgi:hypothetical protein